MNEQLLDASRVMLFDVAEACDSHRMEELDFHGEENRVLCMGILIMGDVRDSVQVHRYKTTCVWGLNLFFR